jgi:hypothetical protein
MYFHVRWKLSVADMVPFKAIQLTQVAKLWKPHDLMKTELCNYHFLMFCAPCILVIIFVQNTN